MSNQFTHGYALLIGIGESAYQDWSLPVAVKDMQALKAILTDANLCAYPDDKGHVRLLRDAGATRNTILAGLDWLKTQAAAAPEATIVVYFSGHGWLDRSTGQYYLIPHDIAPFDIPGTALPALIFNNALRQILAQRLLVFIDSCHAAGMATAKDAPVLKLPSGFAQTALPKGLADDLKRGEGRAVFTSSREKEKSWVRPDGTMSIYTYHLIEALQGAGNQAGDKVVRVSNLMNCLGKAVPESARKLCYAEQTPFFDAATEDFPVAVLLGGKGLPGGGWAAVQHEAAATIRRVVQALGERSVAIGGDVQGSTIVTGDGNVVGDGSSARVVKTTAGGDVVHGDKVAGDKVGGDKITVGDISGSTGVAIGPGAQATVTQTTGASADEIARAFAAIVQAVNAMPEGTRKEDAREAVQKLEAEARRGEQAEGGRVRRWFAFLAEVSADAWEVAVNVLANPIAGIGTVFRKIAARAREERRRPSGS